MRIQHNIAALNAYRQLGGNNNAVSKNLEKLSSGYRINRAGDDAAGLAISEKMRAQITGLDTAQQNAQDGISLVQTAEGALTEVHSMLNRMVELADQSANGTYDNAVDRANLQKEVSSLKDEINRISDGTNYNGIKLLDGSLAGAGGANGGGLVGGKIADWKAATSAIAGGNASGSGANATISFTQTDTLIVDGSEVTVDWSVLNAEDRATLAKNWTNGGDAESAKKAASVMEKTINAAIDKANADRGSSVNHISVKSSVTGAGVTTFDYTSGLKGSGASGISIKNNGTAGLSVLNLVGNIGKTGTAGPTAGTATVASATTQLNINGANLNGRFNMTINGESVEVDMTGSALTATSTAGDIVGALNTAIAAALTNYDAAKGNTGADVLSGKISASFNNDGRIEFSNTSAAKIGFADKDGGEFAKTLGISGEGKAAADGGLVLQIGDTAEDFNQLTVSVDNMSAKSLGIDDLNISTQLGAQSAVDKIKTAINAVSSTRGSLGAIQNRLEHTINNLGVSSENMTAAESRIRDTDMAKEMMAYTKNNILVQSSQAMLAQANQMPQGVLQLLQ